MSERGRRMSNGESATQPKSRHFGCLILLGVAVLFVSFSLYADYRLKKAVRAGLTRALQEYREETVADVRAGNSYVTIYDVQLVEMLVNDRVCRENVTSIHFSIRDFSDPRFRRICEFPNLTELSFYDCDNADNVVVAAKDVPGIESLSFEVAGISDETMRSLAEFPSLKKLHFEQVMPDTRIDELKKLLPHVEIEACLESKEAVYRKNYGQQETAKSE